MGKTNMKIVKNSFKGLTIALACVLAVGFLLLLVDESTITGKITSATTAIPNHPSSLNFGVFVVMLFLIIVVTIIIILKKKGFFLKK